LIYACGGLAVEEGSPAAVTAAAAMSALATAAATPLDAGIVSAVSEPVYATEATSGHHHHHHHHHHRHLLQANVESANPWLVSPATTKPHMHTGLFGSQSLTADALYLASPGIT
jgi:hypothetical protein